MRVQGNEDKMSELKCFRIDEGGEHFHYAAQTAEQALAAYKEDTNEDYEGAQVREVTEEEMAGVTVNLEDDDQYLDGKATLLQVFKDECKGWTAGALQLSSSVY